MQQSLEGLDQIVAPIALYPDILIAQILAASIIQVRLWKLTDGCSRIPAWTSGRSPRRSISTTGIPA